MKKSFRVSKVFTPKFRYQDMAVVCGRDCSEPCYLPCGCWLYTRAYSGVAEPWKRVHFRTFSGAIAFVRKHGQPGHCVRYGESVYRKRFEDFFCAVNRTVYRVHVEVVGERI